MHLCYLGMRLSYQKIICDGKNTSKGIFSEFSVHCFGEVIRSSSLKGCLNLCRAVGNRDIKGVLILSIELLTDQQVHHNRQAEYPTSMIWMLFPSFRYTDTISGWQ